MKTNLLKTLAFGMVLVASTSVFAQKTLPSDVRNYIAITGYNGTTPVTVSQTVKQDFSFTIQMPDETAAVVSAEKAHVEIGLNDTPSLDVTGSRYHEVDMKFNCTFSGDLTKFLSNIYGMPALTVPVTVIDGAKQQSFTYNIAGFQTSDNTIVGTPSSSDDAHKAWYIITDNVFSAVSSTDDSFIGVKGGTYFQLGDEKLTFKEDVNFMEADYTQAGDYSKFMKDVELSTLNMIDADTYKGVIYLPAGSTISVGTSCAVLQKAATINIDLKNIKNQARITGLLSKVIDDLTNTTMSHTQQVIITFMQSLNACVGLANAAQTVPVTVEFTTVPAGLTVYDGETVTPNQSEKQFEEIRKTCPNAVAVHNFGSPVEDNTNVLEPQTNGSYKCSDFELSDLSVVGTSVSTDFSSKSDFVAEKGKYVRKNLPTNGYVTFCFPFDVTSEMLSGSKLYTFKSYDAASSSATFTEVSKVAAGTPALAYANGKDWEIEFDETAIKANTESNDAEKGTFVKTDDYASVYFGVTADNQMLAPLAKDLYPFRASFKLGSTVAPGAKTVAINTIVTAIKNVVSASESKTIYTINGAKVNLISQPGLYIVNGKKTYVK